MTHVLSDEEVGHQILDVFLKHNVRAGGTLRRNYFSNVRDADFQRGISAAVEKGWIKIKPHDRYIYEITELGLIAS